MAGDQLIGINTAEETESQTFFLITLTMGRAAVKETLLGRCDTCEMNELVCYRVGLYCDV